MLIRLRRLATPRADILGLGATTQIDSRPSDGMEPVRLAGGGERGPGPGVPFRGVPLTFRKDGEGLKS